MIIFNYFNYFLWRWKIKDGILLVDKSKGKSSFDVIRILRRKLGIRKMGHAGTLDPLASGLLIIGVEKGTKKLNGYLHLPKTYIIDVLLGKQTDTGDMEGKIISEKKVGEIPQEEIEKVLKSMEGEIELTVPIYSALKLKGRPFYSYAREGISIDLPKRKTQIFRLKLFDAHPEGNCYILKVEMDCSYGTYARSISEEIGHRLGHPATTKDLRRTKIGDFSVEQAVKI
ncbi:MAG: tRNA pseudouridine(55) synthase TruB [Patescibacteria group bacterium]